jgi:S-methylmethionine-dependent homocysteine/selenocysteine methylase
MNAAAAITVLDGGMGRELQRSGAPFRQPEWSALALIEAPDRVAEVHDSFAHAGAQVLTTNSYALVPFHIGAALFDQAGTSLADRAGKVARGVADRHGLSVAGSLPPTFGSYQPDCFDAEAGRAILKALIAGLSPHVDVWLAETLSLLDEARLVAELLIDDNRPLWLSFTLNDQLEPGDRAVLRSGEPVEAAASLAQSSGASALLFNCSYPEVMEAAIREAAAVLGESEIVLGAYANGFGPPPQDYSANAALRDIRPDLGPPQYLEWARSWVAAGATMVGGCCGIGPEHIAALAQGLRHPAGVGSADA